MINNENTRNQGNNQPFLVSHNVIVRNKSYIHISPAFVSTLSCKREPACQCTPGFLKLLLSINLLYVNVCVRACVRACVHARGGPKTILI